MLKEKKSFLLLFFVLCLCDIAGNGPSLSIAANGARGHGEEAILACSAEMGKRYYPIPIQFFLPELTRATEN